MLVGLRSSTVYVLHNHYGNCGIETDIGGDIEIAVISSGISSLWAGHVFAGRVYVATIDIYENVFTRLVRQAGGIADLGDGGVALCGLLARRVASGQISWATAKQYASVIRFKLRQAEIDLDDFERAWRKVQLLRPTARAKRRATRKVGITMNEIGAINALAAVREQRSFQAAAALFHACVLLGLRPCEWTNARWADKARTTLIVRNAKAASSVMEHGPFAGRLWVRGNGAERALNITAEGVAFGVQDLVDDVLAHERALPWSKHRGLIWRSFKRLVSGAVEREMIGPKYRNLTIYSARHQFAADAKRSMNVGAGEVAASMGHVSVRTAVSGYGKRHHGGSFAPAITPDSMSVKAVKSKALRPSRPVSVPNPRPLPSPSPG